MAQEAGTGSACGWVASGAICEARPRIGRFIQFFLTMLLCTEPALVQMRAAKLASELRECVMDTVLVKCLLGRFCDLCC